MVDAMPGYVWGWLRPSRAVASRAAQAGGLGKREAAEPAPRLSHQPGVHGCGIDHLRPQQLSDRARRLPDPLLVLDEREAHEALTALAEADARTDRDRGLLGEPQREGERALVAEPLRDRRPDEHRPARRVDLPAGAGEPGDERIAAGAVDLAHLGWIVAGLSQSDDRRDLDRLEGPVVEVRLQLRKRLHDVGAADDEPDAPTGHRERLRQAVQLDGALVRAVRLQHGRRLVSV